MGSESGDIVLPGAPPDVSTADVETQLRRIIHSASFRKSERRRALLRWLVTRVIEGHTGPVKEHQIGVEVFGKDESWDPRTDPSVRVECNRVRQKLREFYEGEGQHDAVRIELPPRGYVPVFRVQDSVAVPVAEPAPPELPERAPTRWFAAGAVLLAALVAVLVWHAMRRTAAPVSSVAVLPFLDLSSGHQDEYLSDGFTDELTNELAELRGLSVVARTSAFQFKGKSVDVRKIGEMLQVGSVLEGSVLRSGDSIRVVAQLNRTSDGMHLWAGTYDREAKDWLRVQDEITQSIAEALRVKIGRATSGPAFEPGEVARDEYLHGRYEVQKMTPESLRKAATYYADAMRDSPRFAAAWAGMGTVFFDRASFGGVDQRDEFPKAKKYYEDALALDPGLAWAESDLAYINYILDWDWPSAERRFRHALRGGAGTTAATSLGFALMTRGRFAESDALYREAEARDPLNLNLRLSYATVLAAEARGAEAMKEVRFCLDRSPNWFPALLIAAYANLYANHPAEALRYLEKTGDSVPFSPLVLPARAAALAVSGKRADASALLRQIEEKAPEGGFVREHLAIVNAFLGNTDRVFYWLEQSADAHEQQALYIRVDPVLARYQNDARMIALERRMGLRP